MNRRRLKWILAAMCVILMACLTPLTALAAGYGDKGYDTNHHSSYTIDGNDVFVYVTGNGGTVIRISGTDDDSTQQYRAVAEENWEFAYWSTYYYGPATQDVNPLAALGYYYFSVPGDEDTAYDKTSPVIQVNEEVWAAGVYYLQAIFKPKVTLSTNREMYGSAASLHGTSPATQVDNVFISGNTGYVPYGASVKATITDFSDKYILESVTVHDGAFRNDFTYEIDTQHRVLWIYFTATRPTNVTVNVKIKEQTVAFDANGGSGTVSAQIFEHSAPQTLNPNGFTKVGYTFAGWNTAADGSGIDYSDLQSVTFTPANDGDSLTLYAQWTKCNNHSGGNATCADRGVCSSCGEEYGALAEHSLAYGAADNVITETCEGNCGHNATATLNAGEWYAYTGKAIAPAVIEYSPNWQGAQIQNDAIAYNGNVNAGTATAAVTVEGQTAVRNFRVEKAENEWTAAPSITGWTSGQEANAPVYAAAFGQVSVHYSGTAEDGTDWDSIDAPTKAGDYWVSFTVAETENYTGLSSRVAFAVEAQTEPADPENPETGDPFPLAMWTAFLLLSGGALLVLMYYSPKGKANG